MHLFFRDEAVCVTFGPSSPCSSNPMDVVFNWIGHVIVNDKVDVFHVQPSARHICSYQDVCLEYFLWCNRCLVELIHRKLEPGENVVPLILQFISVDTFGLKFHALVKSIIVFHCSFQVVDSFLGMAEYNNFLGSLCCDFNQVICQILILFVIVVQNFNGLGDIIIDR